MAKKTRAIRQHLARCAGKARIMDLTQDDIDRLWRGRINRAEEKDDELHELFKLTAKSLREQITFASDAGDWAKVSLQTIQKYSRNGFSECQNAAFDELIERKRDRNPKRPVPSGEPKVEHVPKPVADTTESLAAPKRSAVRNAYYGSNGAKTKQLYRSLKDKGRDGELAAELLRVQKSSARAKNYKGDFKGYAYARKGERIEILCALLSRSHYHWGWGEDPEQDDADYVLYVDLPNGQISFHSVFRGEGPEYKGSWDGQRASEERVIRFAELLLELHFLKKR